LNLEVPVRRMTRALVATTVLVAGTVWAADAAKEDYTTFCVKCHGAAGKGDGPSAATLRTRPRDFTDCDRMSKITDDVMFKAIKEGGEAAGLSKDMPPWKQGLEDPEIHDLVAYIRAFCKK
jgi:mono/diheme cytochrome c family protein